MESVGFKEWAICCAALGRGEQSIILRKGGIAEGRDGFSFRHPEFYLFPTYFHEQIEKTRTVSREIPPRRDGEIELRFFARVEASAVVTSWETAIALEPLHVWRREVVRERFEYDDSKGIHVAFVRVFRLSRPWILPELPAYGGCRSWVNLPAPPAEVKLDPVLTDEEHDQRREGLKAILASSALPSKQDPAR
jgi:hypothetical protein